MKEITSRKRVARSLFDGYQLRPFKSVNIPRPATCKFSVQLFNIRYNKVQHDSICKIKHYNTEQWGMPRYFTVHYIIVQYFKMQSITSQRKTYKVQHSTVQWYAVQYSTMDCNAAHSCKILHSTVHYTIMQQNTVQCCKVQCRTIQYFLVQISAWLCSYKKLRLIYLMYVLNVNTRSHYGTTF